MWRTSRRGPLGPTARGRGRGGGGGEEEEEEEEEEGEEEGRRRGRGGGEEGEEEGEREEEDTGKRRKGGGGRKKKVTLMGCYCPRCMLAKLTYKKIHRFVSCRSSLVVLGGLDPGFKVHSCILRSVPRSTFHEHPFRWSPARSHRVFPFSAELRKSFCIVQLASELAL